MDLNLVKNDDPRALPRGIYFHSSVPTERRQLLVEDLVWLGTIGPLAASEDLAELLGIKQRPLTGAMLVAWLIERLVIVSSVATLGTSSNGDPVIISGARPNLGLIVFDAHTRKDRRRADRRPLTSQELEEREEEQIRNDPYSAQVLWERRDGQRPDYNWRTADLDHEELDGWRIDGRLLIATENAYANVASGRPTAYLTGTLWRRSSGRAHDDRIWRLSILFHEARHLDSTHPGDIVHFPCPRDSWIRATNGLRLTNILLDYQQAGCDWHLTGAYGVSAALTRTLTKNCATCSLFERYRMNRFERLSWSRIHFPLRNPVAIPDLAPLRNNPGWPGTIIATVPPSVYFTTHVEQINLLDDRYDDLFTKYAINPRRPSDAWGKWRQEIAALTAWLEKLNRKGLIDPQRSVSRWSSIVNDDPSPARRVRPDPDEENAKRWLKAVQNAAGERYNVPLVWMSSCKRFRGGCDARELQTSASPPEKPQAAPPALRQPSVAPGWLGVRIAAVTADVAKAHGLRIAGVRIAGIHPGSPAEKAGLRAEDIILEFDGAEIRDEHDLARKVAAAGVGTEVELARASSGSFYFTSVTLAARPAGPLLGGSAPAIDPGPPIGPSPPGHSLWRHMGSILKLVADGARRRFYYVEPRQGIREHGVTPGTLLFDGQRSGDRYSGTAYIFSRRCGRAAYRIDGDIAPDQRSIRLRGQAPRLDAQCRVTGYKDDHLLFEYVRAVSTASAARTPPPPRQSRQAYTVSSSVSGGILNMRTGPGTGHPIVVGMPAGARGITAGMCRPPDDGQSRHNWCEVEWEGFRGWASSCCLKAE